MNMSLLMQDDYAQFEDEVKRNFYFLEQQYEFRLTQINKMGYSKTIRYESRYVYVNLSYGPPEYEPTMSFGRIGIDDALGAYSFEQGDLIQLKNCENWKWNPAYPNHLIGLISEYSRLLKECGATFLTGDQTLFEEMKAKRDSSVKAWHEQEKAINIRNDAESAWSRKDYVTVVNLYETIKDILTETENKKLIYAKKQSRRLG